MNYLMRTLVAVLLMATSAGPLFAATTAPVTDPAIKADIHRQLELFEQQLAAGNGQQAMATFLGLKTKYPNDADVKAYEGRVFLLQNLTPAAEVSLKAALSIEPDHPLATALLASIEFRAMKVTEAQKRVAAALQVHPDAWELLQMSAEMLIAQQKMADAKPFLEKIIANEGQNYPTRALAPAEAKLGKILLDEGKATEAAALLKQSLELNYDLEPAIVYAHALDQSNADIELLRATVAEVRRRVNAAAGHPQQAQMKQLVAKEFVDIDKKLSQASAQATAIKTIDENAAKLEKELAKDDKTYGPYTAGNYADAMNKEMGRVTDPAVKAEKLKTVWPLRVREALRRVQIYTSETSPRGLDSQETAITRLEEVLKGYTGPDADSAKALAQEQGKRVADAIAHEKEQVMALARSGWLLGSFHAPTYNERKELKERKLPERYGQLTIGSKTALKEYYSELAAKRPNVPLEASIKTWLQSDRKDAAKTAALVEAIAAAVKTIDLSNEKLDYRDVIPTHIWSTPTYANQRLPLTSKILTQRDKGLTIDDYWWEYDVMTANHRWDDLITTIALSIQDYYPEPNLLELRASAHLMKGDYQQARADILLALGVQAWELANVLPDPDSWSRPSPARKLLVKARVYGELASGQLTTSGPFASAPVAAALENIRKQKWDALVDLVLAEHPPVSVEANLVSGLKYSYGVWAEYVGNAVMARYAKSTIQQQAEIAKTMAWWNASEVNVMRYRRETDAAKKEGYLKAAVNNPYRNLTAFWELGKWYEAKGNKADAMMAYNVVAWGQEASTLAGPRRQAAEARDRLEGPTKTAQDIFKVYEPAVNKLYAKQKKSWSSLTSEEAIFLDGVITRLRRVKAIKVPNALYIQSDARRAAGDWPNAIATIRELISLEPDKTAFRTALIAEAQAKMGQYAEALASYSKAIEGGFQEWWAYSGRAGVYVALRQYDKALEDWTATIRANKNNADAYFNRAIYYDLFGGVAKADQLDNAKKTLELYRRKKTEGNDAQWVDERIEILEGVVKSLEPKKTSDYSIFDDF